MASAPCDFEVNETKIKGSCQWGRKVVPHDSKSDLPLELMPTKNIFAAAYLMHHQFASGIWS